MSRAKMKKTIILFVVVLLIIGIGLFFAYEKYKTKSLFQILHVSSGDVTKVSLLLHSDSGATPLDLDGEQAREFCSLLEDCPLKFRSYSDPFVNCYGHAFLWINGTEYPMDIMFSKQYIGISDPQSTKGPTTYTIVNGGDALYEYLNNLIEN